MDAATPPRDIAPREPPPSLLASYTLDGLVPLARFYVNETFTDDRLFGYGREELDGCVAQGRALLETGHWRLATPVDRGDVARAIAAGGDAAVLDARVVVFGATDPWVECLCVAAGAKDVTTVEYAQLEYAHPQMHSTSVDAFERAVRHGGTLAATFDVAIALSAFDHDGLGRYGERLHPDGDLLAVRTAWRALRPGTGRLLLSAPVGPDLLVWNLHRRYGPLRLPRLLAGWHEEARLGWDEDRLAAPSDHRRRYEPLFVLRRNGSEDLGGAQECSAG